MSVRQIISLLIMHAARHHLYPTTTDKIKVGELDTSPCDIIVAGLEPRLTLVPFADFLHDACKGCQVWRGRPRGNSVMGDVDPRAEEPPPDGKFSKERSTTSTGMTASLNEDPNRRNRS